MIPIAPRCNESGQEGRRWPTPQMGWLAGILLIPIAAPAAWDSGAGGSDTGLQAPRTRPSSIEAPQRNGLALREPVTVQSLGDRQMSLRTRPTESGADQRSTLPTDGPERLREPGKSGVQGPPEAQEPEDAIPEPPLDLHGLSGQQILAFSAVAALVLIAVSSLLGARRRRTREDSLRPGSLHLELAGGSDRRGETPAFFSGLQADSEARSATAKAGASTTAEIDALRATVADLSHAVSVLRETFARDQDARLTLAEQVEQVRQGNALALRVASPQGLEAAIGGFIQRKGLSTHPLEPFSEQAQQLLGKQDRNLEALRAETAENFQSTITDLSRRTGILENQVQSVVHTRLPDNAHFDELTQRLDQLEKRTGVESQEVRENAISAAIDHLPQSPELDGGQAVLLRKQLEDLEQRLEAMGNTQAADIEALSQLIAELEGQIAVARDTASESVLSGAVPSSEASGQGTDGAAMQILKKRLRNQDAYRAEKWDAWHRYRDDPCALAVWLVSDYLPTNAGTALLASVDEWLQESFAQPVSLIIPSIGETYDPTVHRKVIGTNSGGGDLYAVTRLVRAGVRCAGKPRRNAEVVVSE